jgi:DHA1 family bicyclomycin/chloramphenicol resistance-like MFS transporter
LQAAEGSLAFFVACVGQAPGGSSIEASRVVHASQTGSSDMTARFLRIAIVLGLISAVGPFAIDMYLPALPSIGSDLSASSGAVQMTLLAFFLAVSVGQILVGPLSDMIGRKAPLYGGLGLFAAGGVGAALSPTIEWLIFFRFVQGFGACAGMVVPRAIVRDLHTGPEATRLMALLMLVFSISPLLAPLSGSIIIGHLGWRAIFWVVTGAAIAGIGLLAFFQAETRPPEERVGSGIRTALTSYWYLLRDGRFLALTFISGFGISSFFVYLSGSSFVFIDHFGLSPFQYSLAFSFNAVSFFAMAQLTGMLTERYGLERVMRVAVAGYMGLMLLLFVLTLAGVDSVEVLMGLLFVGYGFLGLVMPTTTVLALDDHGPIAGAASALMGTLQFAVGVLAMAVVGYFSNGTVLPMVTGIAGCAFAAFLLAQFAAGRPDRAAREGAPAE